MILVEDCSSIPPAFPSVGLQHRDAWGTNLSGIGFMFFLLSKHVMLGIRRKRCSTLKGTCLCSISDKHN